MGRVMLSLASLAIAGAGCSSGDVPAPPGDASADVVVALDGALLGDGAADAAEASSDAGGAADGQVRLLGLGVGAGASFSKSANYRMVWTLGEGPANNASGTSPKYRMTLGVAGATNK